MRPKKDPSLANTMGCKLKFLRKKKFPERGRMREMCDLIGVSPTTWNKWEAGTTIPSDVNQRKIATVFGVTISELRGENAPAVMAGAAGGTSIHPDLAVQYANALAHAASVLGSVVDGSIPAEAVVAAIDIYKTTTQQLLEIRQQESGVDMQNTG